MPERDEKNNSNNCKGKGVSDSPVNQPYYRKTFGLPILREKSPDQLAKEKEESGSREGSLSLADLRRLMAEREALSSEKTPAKTTGLKQKNLVNKMLAFGKFLFERANQRDMPANMEWLQLRVDLDKFSQVNVEILWKAFLAVPPLEQKILSYDYSLGYPKISKRNKPIYSGSELSLAVSKLKVNINCILAYQKGRREGKELREKIISAQAQLFLSHNERWSLCPALTEKPKSQETSSIRIALKTLSCLNHNWLERAATSISDILKLVALAKKCWTSLFFQHANLVLGENASNLIHFSQLAPMFQSCTIHQRQIFESLYGDGLTYKDIKDLRGCSKQSIHDAIFKVTRRLKDISTFWHIVRLNDIEVFSIRILRRKQAPLTLEQQESKRWAQLVMNLNLSNLKEVSHLLKKISLKKVRELVGDSGWRITSADVLLPLCLQTKYQRVDFFTENQARWFFLLFGKIELRLSELALAMSKEQNNAWHSRKSVLNPIRKKIQDWTKKIKSPILFPDSQLQLFSGFDFDLQQTPCDEQYIYLTQSFPPPTANTVPRLNAEVMFSGESLEISSEIQELVKIRFGNGKIDSKKYKPELIRKIKNLSKNEIAALYFLGVKKRSLATVSSQANCTVSVLKDEIIPKIIRTFNN
jgi:predicted DNA-binding protein YlxM (UPF0122 family)